MFLKLANGAVRVFNVRDIRDMMRAYSIRIRDTIAMADNTSFDDACLLTLFVPLLALTLSLIRIILPCFYLPIKSFLRCTDIANLQKNGVPELIF